MRNVITVAADLISEDGTNAEYDRAIVEMAAYLLGLGSAESREAVEALTEAGEIGSGS